MANQLYKGDKPLATFIPQIADNLTTDDSTKALSAKQGKVLNEKIETLKTGNLVQGAYYSTYVNTNYKSTAEEKNGIVHIDVVIELKAVAISSGWKEIFTLPSNITKPNSVQTINVIMGDNKYNQFRIGTDGTVSLNGGIATVLGSSYVGNIMYLV